MSGWAAVAAVGWLVTSLLLLLSGQIVDAAQSFSLAALTVIVGCIERALFDRDRRC